MGMGSGSQKRKAAYDPQRKWGLQPANGPVGSPSSSQMEGGEGPTYVVAGHIVAGGAAGKQDMFLKEKLGREAQARAARRTNSRDTDVALKRLLARDKEGMKAVQEARKFAMKAKAKEREKKKTKTKRIPNGKKVGKETGDDDGESSANDEDEEEEEEEDTLADRPKTMTTTKNAYSARVIKELGFDPTVKSLRGSHGRRRRDREEEGGDSEEGEEPEGSRNEIYSKVLSVSSLFIIPKTNMLMLRCCSFIHAPPPNFYFFIYMCEQLRELASSCRQPDKIKLGPRPGGRVRSVVSAPPKEKFKLSLVGPIDSEEGLGMGMVDLDESSSGCDDE